MAQTCKWLCALNQHPSPLSVRRWHSGQKQIKCLVQLAVKILNFGRSGWLSKWEEDFWALPRLVWAWTGLPALEALDSKEGDSMVKGAAEKQPTGYTQLKKTEVMGWGQLLVVLWRTTGTKRFCCTAAQQTQDKAVTGPSDWRGPSYEKDGSQTGALAWPSFPLSHQGWCQLGCSLSSNSWTSSRDVVTFLPNCCSYTWLQVNSEAGSNRGRNKWKPGITFLSKTRTWASSFVGTSYLAIFTWHKADRWGPALHQLVTVIATKIRSS